MSRSQECVHEDVQGVVKWIQVVRIENLLVLECGVHLAGVNILCACGLDGCNEGFGGLQSVRSCDKLKFAKKNYEGLFLSSIWSGTPL